MLSANVASSTATPSLLISYSGRNSSSVNVAPVPVPPLTVTTDDVSVLSEAVVSAAFNTAISSSTVITVEVTAVIVYVPSLVGSSASAITIRCPTPNPCVIKLVPPVLVIVLAVLLNARLV